MSRPFNTISITLFVVFNIAALTIVTNGWNEPWVSSAYGSAYNFEYTPDLTSMPATTMEPNVGADSISPYPYPIPVSMTRSGNEVSLLAQIRDLFLTILLSTNDVDQGVEVNLYRLDNVNSLEQARIIGSAFKTEFLDQNGQPVTELDEPITVVFTYDDSGMIEGDEEALQLYKWDESMQKWVPIESSVDIAQNTITATIHVGGRDVAAANGQSMSRSDAGSIDLALIGRTRLYLPTIQ